MQPQPGTGKRAPGHKIYPYLLRKLAITRSWPRKMESLVRPELPTASVGSSQAPTAAMDNSASLANRTEST